MSSCLLNLLTDGSILAAGVEGLKYTKGGNVRGSSPLTAVVESSAAPVVESAASVVRGEKALPNSPCGAAVD